jgi:hypothetical protein
MSGSSKRRFTLNVATLWKRHFSKKPWFELLTQEFLSDGCLHVRDLFRRSCILDTTKIISFHSMHSFLLAILNKNSLFSTFNLILECYNS